LNGERSRTIKNAKLVQRYLGHSDVATTLRYYMDACPVQKSKILYGVFPEDLEEAAEMLAER